MNGTLTFNGSDISLIEGQTKTIVALVTTGSAEHAWEIARRFNALPASENAAADFAREAAKWRSKHAELRGAMIKAVGELQNIMSQGFGNNFDKAQRQYDNMHDDPSYQDLVAELAKECRCTPNSDRPCDGLLAGGLCDDVQLETREACDGFDDN